MCDNIVALGSATADGSVIFGKNSDREPNEPHHVMIIPRATHAKRSVTHCTFIDIPQVKETYAVLLCKPSWLWGAEMGANEYGLVIGNTAVFTKESYDTRPGLIGMDYLRLALERTTNAPAALELITNLLEQYGQSGNNGFSHELYYHNSFLIADPQEAWVLETVGMQWVAKRVQDIGGTSNTLTIGTEWDLASDGLITYAQARGWHKDGQDFNFKKAYGGSGFSASYLYTVFGNGDERHQRLTGLLGKQKGQITVEVMMNALRDHGPKADANYTPAKGKLENPPCMHAGDGPVRVGQTTGSLVSQLTPKRPTHWVTATAAPCTSIFKPVWIDAGLPDLGLVPTGRYNRATLWWRHEFLHREVLKDYATRLAVYQAERDQMEARFVAGAREHQAKAAAERAAFTAQCFQEADQATDRWTEQVIAVPPQQKLPRSYRKVWEKLDKQCGSYSDYRPDFASSPAG
jgi:dipeptidase